MYLPTRILPNDLAGSYLKVLTYLIGFPKVLGTKYLTTYICSWINWINWTNWIQLDWIKRIKSSHLHLCYRDSISRHLLRADDN